MKKIDEDIQIGFDVFRQLYPELKENYKHIDAEKFMIGFIGCAIAQFITNIQECGAFIHASNYFNKTLSEFMKLTKESVEIKNIE